MQEAMKVLSDPHLIHQHLVVSMDIILRNITLIVYENLPIVRQGLYMFLKFWFCVDICWVFY